ncbi:hypothetical protein [Yinghuangia sp. ASG 101]|uniref:hypothetical protein n=1 Tax=Yinghuangia sp. ASG 101 TaxID=2896848 RepID=UPI002F90706C
MGIAADLAKSKIETSVEFDGPDHARQLTRVRWLTRQLENAPDELRVEALVEGVEKGPCELLRVLRTEPALLVPEGDGIAGFRLTLATPMGSRRGAEETGFIRSVDNAVDRFHGEVMRVVKPAAARGARAGDGDEGADDA